MRKILFVCMMVMSMGNVMGQSEGLWRKVEKAQAEGKPQAAVGYLDKLEKLAEGDTLELYYIAEMKYEELCKYNWKAANSYNLDVYASLGKSLLEDLDKSVEKYAGHRREIILLYERLVRQKYEVDRKNKERTGEDYLKVRKECQKLLKRYPSGKYAEMVRRILEAMDRTEVNAGWMGQIAPTDSARFEVTVKNVPILSVAVFRLKENEIFEQYGGVAAADKDAALRRHCALTWSSRFDKIKNEYNIEESLKIHVKLSEEGVYVVCFNYGKEKAYVNVNVSRTVAAVRELGGKMQIYAADFESGRPLENYDAALLPAETKFDRDGFAKAEPLERRAVRQDGFTDLPFAPDPQRLVRAEAGGSTASPALPLFSPSYYEMYRNEASDGAALFTDRTLYGPADTIWFKVIKYSTSGNRLSGSVVANAPVAVSLKYERENETVAKCNLTTNGMGSASGFFTLPQGAKNGSYRIFVDEAYQNSVRVEEYVRPDFSLELDRTEQVYCFNDIVKLSGTFRSFAGYSVAGAKVSYEVYQTAGGYGHRWYSVPRAKVDGGGTVTDGDGRFAVDFAARRSADLNNEQQIVTYEVQVTVTDAQGETHRQTSFVRVSDYPLDIEVKMERGRFECIGADTEVLTNSVVNKTVARTFTPVVTNLTGVPQDVCGTYALTRGGKVALEGQFRSGQEVPCDFSKLASGLYALTFKVPYRGKTIEEKTEFYLVGESDPQVPFEADFFSYKVDGEDGIKFLVGTSRSDLYLEMELFSGAERVSRTPLHLSSEMRLVELPFEKAYGTSVCVSLFGICRGNVIDHQEQFTRPERHDIDVEIVSLRDRAKPDSDESMTVKAPAGTELMVSIFDVTSERYRKNSFDFTPLESVIYSRCPNVVSTLGAGGRIMVRGASKAAYMGLSNDAVMMDSATASFGEADAVAEEAAEAVELRSERSELIAFRPHVQVAESGEAVIPFRTGGLMSTFRVAVMGHTKDLKSGTTSKTFIVQKDVMVKPSLPLFAREGDRITLRAKVVNLGAEALEGRGSIEFFDAASGRALQLKGAKPVELELLAGGQGELAWDITVPSNVKKLGVKIWYKAGSWTDGEQNVISVEPSKITLTEAASFVIGGPHGHKYYEKQLRAQFPVANPKVTYAEYSTMDAVKESLPAHYEPKYDNMIEQLSAFYINQMRRKVVDASAAAGELELLLKFQGADGGFCWFSQMPSSPMLTLLFLERMAQLRDFGAVEMGAEELAAVRKALTYIDSNMRDGYASICECSIRSRWLSEPMDDRAAEIFRKKLSDTEKDWQNLPILEKANLILLLQNCRGTDFWKESFDGRIDKLAASLADYAVENPTVGVYFPNAVMPYRGLMNSEIYAHSRLIDVFSRLERKKMVDGIAQWLLLQKHNQAWENTVATTDAVHALLTSGAKDLRLGAVYYTYETPLSDVRESSNELTITRTFTLVSTRVQSFASQPQRNASGPRTSPLHQAPAPVSDSDSARVQSLASQPLSDGDTLALGDIVRVRYEIENSENRSFVQLRAMRPAGFYPTDERSGYSWGGYYREVSPSETNFFFELLPEGKTVIEEEFYVSQSGRFAAGIGAVECLYAPEYRAHTASRTVLSR